LQYFVRHGHQRVNSSSLVPKNDPTLLFTNAGMNQFKDVFLGRERRSYSRATSSQKCMRVSGKHNDLETVGRTPRHHTFFEMLGNFSFGDYFKKEACEFAWELCTEVYGLEPNRLIITVFEEDDEAYEIWSKHIGISEERIFRCDEKENFWAMGETGPCGPCSELHFDMGDRIGDTESPFGSESDRWVEIWNLVFMQYNRDAEGNLTPLPSPSIDTGMGLERITSVLQGVAGNYETDLFKPLIEEAGRLTGVSYGKDPEADISLRILADHCRAAMFLISDGIVPSNEKRGYVLRKILRRAIRHGILLEMEEPFIYTLTALAGNLMSEAYPELLKSRDYAARVVRNEEERFSTTLRYGMKLLEEVLEKARESGSRVAGEDLFRLYDTYGFPLDLAGEIAAEQNLEIDREGFDRELEKQRERARASWKGGAAEVRPIYRELADRGLETDFTGYDRIRDVPARILSLIRDGEVIDSVREGEESEVILDRSPFYAEAGGQVGDRGIIENERFQADVVDTRIPVANLRVHQIRVLHGAVATGDEVNCSVDSDLRRSTAGNHTATHLLHAALREVLGEHVKQAGSLVAPDRLRFDFIHYKALSDWEIRQIEEIVNQKIRENLQLNTQLCDLEEAIRGGATALFGEKYDEKVRVVSIDDFSRELCGGTHVERTGDIALFKIVSESSIAAGVRRIEAVTGQKAVERFLESEELLDRLAAKLQVGRSQVLDSIEKLSSELKSVSRDISRLQLETARQEGRKALAEAREIRGVRIAARSIPNLDRETLRQVAEELKNRIGSGVVILGSENNGKASLVVMVTADLTGRIRANEIIRPIARVVGGGGGGRSDLAEAGGKDPSAMNAALEESYRVVEEALG